MKKNQVGKCYKKGGKVKPAAKKAAKKEMKVEGIAAMPRLDKPAAFKRGGSVKKGSKTTVNVIVGGEKPAPIAPPIAPPMVPPPGMKTGGRVPKMTAGAGGGKGRLQKAAIEKKDK